MKRLMAFLLLLTILAAPTAFAAKKDQKPIEGFSISDVCEVKDIELGEFDTIDEKNCRVTVSFRFVNLANSDCYFHDVVSLASLSFMGKYDFEAESIKVLFLKNSIASYESFKVVDNTDYLLDPLCEAQYKAYFVVPKVVASPDRELTMILRVGKENCEITLR